MALENKQDIKISQQQVMTPQMQLAVKLLQLSRMELVEMVKEELEVNPVLEDESRIDETESGSLIKEKEADTNDWESHIEKCYERQEVNRYSGAPEESSLETNAYVKTTLTEHLMWQLNLSQLTPEERIAGEFIVGNIDEDGYLRFGESNSDEAAYLKSITSEIATAVNVSEDVVGGTIKMIQQFDPIGVGSRTLKECLLIQAESMGCKNNIVEDIINDHLYNLENKNYKKIAAVLKISMDDIVEAVKIITGFRPRPGSTYGQPEANLVIPDIHIQKVGKDYVITLNENGLPKLRISSYYMELLFKNGKGKDETKSYVQERLRSAKWLIQSIFQRQRTIYNVAQSILKLQRGFFDNGPFFVKPLTMREVALDIGMHESTISRATANKYVNTPHGIFELKYFFSPKIDTEDKENNMSSKSVIEKIKGIFADEDITNPLSDQRIFDILKSSGINIARRTIAKYREALGILPAYKRKRLF